LPAELLTTLRVSPDIFLRDFFAIIVEIIISRFDQIPSAGCDYNTTILLV